MARHSDITLMILLLVVSTSCGGSNTDVSPDSQIVSFSTSTPSPITEAPPAPSHTPEPPPPSSTPSPLPEEISEAIRQTYLAIFLIQIDAQLVEEAASRTQSGDLTGFEQVGALLAIAALIEGVDQSLAEIMPPESLTDHLGDARLVHGQTKSLLAEWFNDEIDSAEVSAGMGPILLDAERVIAGAEQTLAEVFGFDLDQLAEERQETLDSLPDIFESTPTPSS